MPNEPIRRVARVDKLELSELPSQWTNGERGHYLRLLLQLKGIDTGRLFTTQYYPHRHCWLLTQDSPPAYRPLPPASPPTDQEDELFYLQASAEFHRTARAAFAALAAQSPHFAQFGRHYQLPPESREMTPAELAELLGGQGESVSSPRFDSEGGWQAKSSQN